MMLSEIANKPGTYAGVRFDDDSTNRLAEFQSKLKIPNAISPKKFHVTLLHSKKHLPNYKPQGKINPPYKGTPSKLVVWKTQPDEEGETSNCLVLQFDCPELVKRHKALMDEHGAQFDYNKFEPHVTLSYSIGDLDIKDANLDDIGSLNMVEEYHQPLDLSWAKKNS